MKTTLLTLFICFICYPGFAQQSCPQSPPDNPFIPDTPWPTYHKNSFAQASTCLPGPAAGDMLQVIHGNTPFNRASPWLYFTEKYQNGQRALLGTNASHAFKSYFDGNQFRTIDSLRIDFDLFDFGWNFLLTNDKVWYTHDNINGSGVLYKLSDADTSDFFSEIVALDTFNLADIGVGECNLYNLTYDGWIAFNSNDGIAGVIKQDFSA